MTIVVDWQLAERTAGNEAAQLLHRGPETAVESDAEFHAVLAADAHRLGRSRCGERKGLLHENVLAGAGGLLYMGRMQRVWRGEDHALNARIGQQLGVIIDDVDAVFAGKLLDIRRRACSARHHFDLPALALH